MSSTPRAIAIRGKKLQDWGTTVGSIPVGSIIYWDEVAADIGTRNARISTNVDDGFTAEFWTNQDVIDSPTLNKILFQTILGGFSDVDNKKHTPFKWPGMPGMFAKDILGIQSCSPEKSDGLPIAYGWAKVLVSFESRPYRVDLPTSSGQPNLNWYTPQERGANQRIQTPLGYYQFADGPFASPLVPIMSGNYIVQPMNFIRATIHQVTHSQLYGGDNSIKSILTQYEGKVNSSAFATTEIESVLFDTYETRSYSDFLNSRLYDVTLNLVYTPWTWNKQLGPDQNLYRVKNPVSGNPPFSTFNLTTVWNQLNPG